MSKCYNDDNDYMHLWLYVLRIKSIKRICSTRALLSLISARKHSVCWLKRLLLFSYLRKVIMEPRNKRQKTGYLFPSIVFCTICTGALVRTRCKIEYFASKEASRNWLYPSSHTHFFSFNFFLYRTNSAIQHNGRCIRCARVWIMCASRVHLFSTHSHHSCLMITICIYTTTCDKYTQNHIHSRLRVLSISNFISNTRK